MKIILLLISFLGAIVAKDPLALCSSQTEFDFESITFSPPAPVVGKDLIVRASGALKVAVTPGSQFKLVLKFGPIKVFEKSSYVCNPDSTTDCWTPGHYNDLEAIFPIPGNVPLRQFHVQVDFTDAQGSSITCIQGDVKFTGPQMRSDPNLFDMYDLEEDVE